MCSGWQGRQKGRSFLFLQLFSSNARPDQRSNNFMHKYSALRALFIWLSVTRTWKCDTFNIKTGYCIWCKGTGCVLSGGLELQLRSSLTLAPFAGGWWTAHLGRCTARERALSTYGVGGFLGLKTVLDTLEERKSCLDHKTVLDTSEDKKSCLDLKTVLDSLEERKYLVPASSQTKFPLLALP
jgi:hypothetical protein